MSDYTKNSVPCEDSGRCLAQIVKVVAIEPIPKADSIELATVLGWLCVVKKGEFKIGDLAVYISIDAVLDPQNKHFAFLEGKRLKTKKILGVISQGLLGPLSWLPHEKEEEKKEGTNVTALLNVRKYVAPAEMDVYKTDNKTTAFPNFVPRTDEERIENLSSGSLPRLVGQPVIITRKEDGTSVTFVFCRGTFLVCSRNNAIDAKSDAVNHRPYLEMAKKHDLEVKMAALGKNIAIQGEIVGPKINGGRLKIKENELRVFNGWDIDNARYLPWEEVKEICTKCGIQTVPVIYEGEFKKEWESVSALRDMATRLEYAPNLPAEGMVVKTNTHPRVSFKVISPTYLLRYGL